MIAVTAIIGESYNLTTGDRTAKAIRLSNGQAFVDVEVSDAVVEAVVGMSIDSPLPEPAQVTVRPVPLEDAPDLRVVKSVVPPGDQESYSTTLETPINRDEETREPGEYYDPASGTESI